MKPIEGIVRYYDDWTVCYINVGDIELHDVFIDLDGKRVRVEITVLEE